MDYKRLIIEMIERIEDEKILRIIYYVILGMAESGKI